MEVRYATPDDADAGSLVLRRSIVELCQADHNGNDAVVAAWIGNKTPETWKSWVEQDGTELYVAVERDRIIGVGMLDHTGTIRLNYVSPDHRWRGVSKALLAHMEERVCTRGLRQCLLESTNTARPFYEAAGYRGTGDGGWMSKTIDT